MIRAASIVLLAAAVGLSSACSTVAPPRREVVLRIEPSLPSSAAVLRAPPLSLEAVAASQSASARRYVYIDPARPREVQMAATLFWEEPPPVMVQAALARGLAARLGAPLLSAGTAGDPRRLNVQLDRFEEEAGASASAVVALQGTLIDSRSRQAIFSRSYCVSSRIAGAQPSDRARAFEASLNRIMDRLANDIAGASQAAPADSAAQAADC